jgi:hypothetical protein
MITNEKAKTHVEQRREPAKDQQSQLDEELEESFPASDPPSVTQPGVKMGAPEHKPSTRK